jgi:hypothetical protein
LTSVGKQEVGNRSFMSKWSPTVHQAGFDIVATKLDTIDFGNRPRRGQHFSEKLKLLPRLDPVCVIVSQTIVRMRKLEFAFGYNKFRGPLAFRAPDITSLQICL